MKNYTLIVEDGKVTIPQNIPNGHYRLVEIADSTNGLHRWEDIDNYITFFDSRRHNNLARAKHYLQSAGYTYVEDLKDVPVQKIFKIRHLGVFTTALIIAICEMFSVNIASKGDDYTALIESCKNCLVLKNN